MLIFKLILILHLLVDFYFQSDDSIQKKENEKIQFSSLLSSEMFKHFVVNTLLFSLIFLIFQTNQGINVFIIYLLIVSHIVIDCLKVMLSRCLPTMKKSHFVIDQLFHMIILFLISHYLSINFTTNFNLAAYSLHINAILSILLLSKTSNVIFNTLFSNFKPKDELEDNEHKNAGALIGTMERLLIMGFLILGNATALGFIIAAKSLARYSKLSKTQFGEYFILGTLYSTLYTLIVYFSLFHVL